MAEIHQPHAATDGTTNPATRHETTDINIRGVFAFAVGLIVVGVFVHVFLWLLFVYFNGREMAKVSPQYPLAIGQETRLPPEPRLQINPREAMRELRSSEDAVLNGYGWVDKNKGIVRIPIDEAMKLTLERGLPVRQGKTK
jgi:hypothetical protein